MTRCATSVLLASLLLSFSLTSASSAEREDVRKVINLVASVKMPYPEGLQGMGQDLGCLARPRWCNDRLYPA